MARHLHVDKLAVFFPMLPHAERARTGAGPSDGSDQRIVLLGRANVLERHLHELFARVSVVPYGGVIDGEESKSLRVVEPFGYRALLEQNAISLCALPERVLRFGEKHRRAALRIDHRIDLTGEESLDRRLRFGEPECELLNAGSFTGSHH